MRVYAVLCSLVIVVAVCLLACTECGCAYDGLLFVSRCAPRFRCECVNVSVRANECCLRCTVLTVVFSKQERYVYTRHIRMLIQLYRWTFKYVYTCVVCYLLVWFRIFLCLGIELRLYKVYEFHRLCMRSHCIVVSQFRSQNSAHFTIAQLNSESI